MTLHYSYKRTSTEATTGYFSCEPNPPLSIEEQLNYLSKSPFDEFLHKHLLNTLINMPLENILNALTPFINGEKQERLVTTALLLECAMLNPSLKTLAEKFNQEDIAKAEAYSPLPHLKWLRLEHKELHRAWSAVFNANIFKHHKLPHPEELSDEGLSPLYEIDIEPAPRIEIQDIYLKHKAQSVSPWSRPPAQETSQQALSLLLENDILDGVEMRHEASLSPMALLRNWKVRMQVQSARHDYSVEGQATTYGRGLSLANTRASYAMEMIERACAYVSVKDLKIHGLANQSQLVHAKYSELLQANIPALNPNDLPLEIPYDDAKIYWIHAESKDNTQTLVPAQAIFLFWNLDEPALFMNPGSTGLATGNIMDEAKVAAIVEILERDAENIIPYERRNCFTLRSKDERLQALLDDYKYRGINIQFLDLTSEFGVPCYQAFVMDKRGEIIRATGAGLCGARAAISALTEVPYPYPHGPASGPALVGIEEKVLEDLPDYTLASPAQNLALLEDILHKHGYTPLYVDMTQEDLEFPVVRAIIPGLELGAEFDEFSRIPKRLYANYLKLFN